MKLSFKRVYDPALADTPPWIALERTEGSAVVKLDFRNLLLPAKIVPGKAITAALRANDGRTV